ncbi:hypothetical protein PFAG_03942 [Plasmodium falciparum Santa Lucia]|uniref:Uncharacterized protein n=1 Tax=Plasmodium falciparum Santa Lucia TaxID=478859 RepID=W7FS40_PLAFA|nr:hypothetical protein PFAG_03942 [Plasmodium falciparum Santa Lucia]
MNDNFTFEKCMKMIFKMFNAASIHYIEQFKRTQEDNNNNNNNNCDICTPKISENKLEINIMCMHKEERQKE